MTWNGNGQDRVNITAPEEFPSVPSVLDAHQEY